MKLNAYKFTCVGYHFYLAYDDSLLTTILAPKKTITWTLWSRIMGLIPQSEKDLQKIKTVDLQAGQPPAEITIRPLTDKLTFPDKIVLFNSAYRHYRGAPYYPKETEKANLAKTPLNRELVQIFFETPGLTNYTLGNYIKRINITRDYAVNGFPDSRQPDTWDRAHWVSLDDQERLKYEQHLYRLGYRKQNGPQGTYYAKP